METSPEPPENDKPSEPEPTPSSETVDNDEKNLAVLAHLLAILTSFIVPLVIFLIKNDDKNSYAREQALEALNFQITVLIAMVIASLTTCLFIGIVLIPLVMIANLVFCILAGVACSRGEHYRYPYTLRLIS